MNREIRKLQREIKNAEMMIVWSKKNLRKSKASVWADEQVILGNTEARDKAQARLTTLLQRQEEDKQWSANATQE